MRTDIDIKSLIAQLRDWRLPIFFKVLWFSFCEWSPYRFT